MNFKTLFICSLLIFWGCSAPKKRFAPERTPQKKINFGPTEVSSPLFLDHSKELGLDLEAGSHFYAVDFNSDSYTDLVFLPDQFSSPSFYKYLPKEKKFKKLTYYPFARMVPASFLNFADLDKDGVLDVLVGTLNQQSNITPRPLRLFKGVLIKGKINYKEVKNAFSKKVPLPTASAVFLDFDLDGHLDLYVGNWFTYRKGPKLSVPDDIYKGDGLKFSLISGILRGEHEFHQRPNVYLNAKPTIGVSTCDVDKNGYPDILTASSLGYGNKLWLNLKNEKTGDRVYIDYGVESGYAMEGPGLTLAGGNSFFSLCGDYNGDQIFDILVGEFNYSHDFDGKDRSGLLKGYVYKSSPRFMRDYRVLDQGRRGLNKADRRGNFVDFDNDSHPDILIDDSGFPPDSRLYLLKQNKKNDFKNISDISGLDVSNPAGTVLLDINRDGLMDVITGQVKIRNNKIKPKTYLFLNKTQNKNRSLRFFLRGKKANIRGIGSLVTLTTNTGKQMKWVQSANGATPSQNEEGPHFGLPLGTKALKVSVKWPIKGMKVKTYNLKFFKFKNNLDLTLCESGKIKIGRPRLGSCRL